MSTPVSRAAQLAGFDCCLRDGPKDAHCIETVVALVRGGANPNQRADKEIERYGPRPTYSILDVVMGDKWNPKRNALVREMLELGADPNWIGPTEAELLETLIPHASAETLRVLHKVIPQQKDKGCQPALEAAHRFALCPINYYGSTQLLVDYDLYELLIEYGADPNLSYDGGSTPLERARKKKDERLIEIFESSPRCRRG